MFGFDRPIGMHLREYTYTELATAARRAGFVPLAAPLGLPARLRGGGVGVRASRLYLAWLEGVERALAGLSPRRRRRALDRYLRVPLFRRDLWLVATAPR